MPFGELSSEQFEKLVGELLKAEGHSNIRYWGISGGDGGCDISSTDAKGYRWISQVKNTSRPVGPRSAIAELEKVLREPPRPEPEIYLLATASQVSRGLEERLKAKLAEHGKAWTVQCWGKAEFETLIRSNPEVERRFFGSYLPHLPHAHPDGTLDWSSAEIQQYRRAVIGALENLPFLGWGSRRAGRAYRVQDLFVSCKLKPANQAGPLNWWSTTDLTRNLTLKRSQSRHIVLLGNAGSGKSTICRFIATQIAVGSSQLVPIYLRLRDYRLYRQQRPEATLIQFVAEYAGRLLQASFTITKIEEGLKRRHLLLLFDGLDEAGSTGERGAFRDDLVSLSASFPEVPILVASRKSGFEKVPIPSHGPRGFQILEIKALGGDLVRQLAVKFFLAQGLGEPEAEGLAKSFSQSLRAKRNLEDLAEVPFLVTLLLLIYRDHGSFPSNRAAIFEEALKLIFRSWPSASGRQSFELPLKAQFEVLSAAALEMQEAAKYRGSHLLLQKRDLGKHLSRFLAAEGRALDPESLEDLLEAWIEFLEETVGLLVWVRHDQFELMHRSLMEYLAARAVADSLDGVGAIVRHYRNESWYEVCLLAVSRRAEDSAFLGRLFDALSTDRRASVFLLRCLTEDAVVDPDRVHAVLRQSGREILAARTFVELPDNARFIRGVFDEVLLHAQRNAAIARSWLEEEARSSLGDDLWGLAALCWDEPSRIIGELDHHRDRGKAAGQLIGLWPGSEFGRWAADRIPPEEMVHAFNRIAGIQAIPNSLISLIGGSRLGAGALLALVLSASQIAALDWKFGRPFSSALPRQIVFSPSGVTVYPRITWLWDIAAGEDEYSYFLPNSGDSGYVTTFSGSSAFYSKLYILKALAGKFKGSSKAGKFWANCGDNFLFDGCLYKFRGRMPAEMNGFSFPESMPSAERYFVPGVAQAYVRTIIVGFLGEIGWYKPALFNKLTAQPSGYPIAPGSPSEVRSRTGETTWELRLFKQMNDKKLISYVFPGLVRLGAEAWCGELSAVDGAPFADVLAVIHRRIQNAYLHQAWPVLEEFFPADLDPAQLALYLALGWTQATTTRRWPTSPRWRALAGGSPPQHWLPRSQWHLAWLLHEPSSTAHREGLSFALSEGRSHGDHPGATEALERIFPGGKEVRYQA